MQWLVRRKALAAVQAINVLGTGSKWFGTREPMMTLYVRQISARPARRWITAWAGSPRLAVPPPFPTHPPEPPCRPGRPHDSSPRPARVAGTPSRSSCPSRMEHPIQLTRPPDPTHPPHPTRPPHPRRVVKAFLLSGPTVERGPKCGVPNSGTPKPRGTQHFRQTPFGVPKIWDTEFGGEGLRLRSPFNSLREQ